MPDIPDDDLIEKVNKLEERIKNSDNPELHKALLDQMQRYGLLLQQRFGVHVIILTLDPDENAQNNIHSFTSFNDDAFAKQMFAILSEGYGQ